MVILVKISDRIGSNGGWRDVWRRREKMLTMGKREKIFRRKRRGKIKKG